VAKDDAPLPYIAVSTKEAPILFVDLVESVLAGVQKKTY
jgi:hypothetical protein